MNSIESFFRSQGMNFTHILIICGILLLGTMVLSLFGRIVFGKHSTLNSSVSSAIGILFIYTLTIVVFVFFKKYFKLLAPLPFLSLGSESAVLFSFAGGDYLTISSQLLSMIILAFFMNLIDRWMPEGKNFFTWLLFRILTVGLGMLVHAVSVILFHSLLPYELTVYSPVILLALLVILLLTGALKLIVGMVMATVNPLIAALYTFFFANIVGKQLTKAMLTTAILAGLVYLMEQFGVFSFSITVSALIAYIPFIFILAAMWFVVRKSL